MKICAQTIKEKMSEFARLFSIERNIFQRFVIAYKYFTYLNTDPVIKGILQKIFDDTAKVMGEPEDNMDEDKFLDVKGEALYSNSFWMYYTNLEIIHDKMKKLKKCHLENETDCENLKKLFSKPYSKKMFELSFEVVNMEIFNRLDQEAFCEDDERENETYFDEEKSQLFIKGRKVLVNKQDRNNNEHKLLHHIFITNKDNLKDDFFYSEIAEDEFHELDYKTRKNNWKKYHNTCCYLNQKIEKEVGLAEFLICNTGKAGKVNVNKKYL